MKPFSTRRDSLLARMQARGGGVAIVGTAPEVMRNRDADYPYRHDSYFYYLTGFTEPEAVLVLVAGRDAAHHRALLFCRDKNLEREIWDGYRYGPAAAREKFGFDQAFPIEQLDVQMPALLSDAGAIYCALPADKKMDDWLAGVRALGRSGVNAPSSLHDIAPLLDEMRLIKDNDEIALMARAGVISAAAHRRAMRIARPGLHEYQLEAELLHEFRNSGSQAPAYGSIVATGANACVLHYRAGDALLKDGDLVLIDAGCELDSYAADITRTFPANGKFTGPQKTLYEIVLASQAAAIAATRPGCRFNDAHDAALRVLTQGMLDTGLLDGNKVGSLEDAISSGAYRQFYMHRTGHWLGMDVHDVGRYYDADDAGDAAPAAASDAAQTADTAAAAVRQRPSRTLQPGMVVTVEPGIYVRPAPEVPEQYWNIGIRIEDDALLTADGCRILSSEAPSSVADIEALMRQD